MASCALSVLRLVLSDEKKVERRDHFEWKREEPKERKGKRKIQPQHNKREQPSTNKQTLFKQRYTDIEVDDVPIDPADSIVGTEFRLFRRLLCSSPHSPSPNRTAN